ncbi:histidine kinase [Luteolibacter flavescens]|uniref:Histidine kinase n=1 Tax=Luteolibacter flavescens TaxID=1859460 RepID=A0ABT3FS44_9BACT|nr:histidine kinase [Luteolibacter flavescens]MCW1886404.1 histidine kinase [Luteolibacter flavescens]
MKFQLMRLPGLCVALSLLTALLPDSIAAATPAQTMNPIGRVARLFNRSLVDVEARVQWLQSSLGYLAIFEEKPLKEELGWRCGSLDETPGKPWVALDLGRDVPLGEIFLIPAQRQTGDMNDLFPRRFTVEAACQADFSDARVIHSSGTNLEVSPGGYPLRLTGDGQPARHIRLTLDEGHHRGLRNAAALSEIFVFNFERHPVSFGATVTSSQSVDVPGIWSPKYLVDGRTPLGLWEGGASTWTTSRGDCLEVTAEDPRAEWVLDFGKSATIDRLVLFPYSLPELSGPGVVPPRMRVEVADNADFSDAREVATTGKDDLPTDLTTPLVLPTQPAAGRYLRIVSDKAWQLGTRYLQALGEIEAWEGNENRSNGLTISVRNSGLDHPISELTDGVGSHQILPIYSWLTQLVERRNVESKLGDLNARRITMAAESELNTTWGGAIALGLTFLIPVAIVERRRLVSRTQLDKLRKRIASDLHDDIGSNLGSISIIARSAKRDLEKRLGPDDLTNDLGEVETIARESSLAMRDIVWLLERRQDTIGDLVQRMRDCAARLLRDVEYSLVCRSSKTTAKLTLDAKRHLFLFYKEALHNIVKHSKATTVIVRLYDVRDRLVMEVVDNGVGLPRGQNDQMAAVKKIHDRARVLEGTLQVESEPGKGTTLRLSVKRANLMATKKMSHE